MTACPLIEARWSGPPHLALCTACHRPVRVKRDKFVYHVFEEKSCRS